MVEFKEKSEAEWINILKNARVQRGRGIRGFVGHPYQRGNGFGSIIKGLWRAVGPVVKSIGKSVGKQTLKTGVGIAGDIARGDKFKESFKRRGKIAGKSILKKSMARINRKIQTGRGRKKYKKKKQVGKRGRPKKRSTQYGGKRGRKKKKVRFAQTGGRKKRSINKKRRPRTNALDNFTVLK